MAHQNHYAMKASGKSLRSMFTHRSGRNTGVSVLLALCAMISGFCPLYGQESVLPEELPDYEPLIREDRIWEYYVFHSAFWYCGEFKMKFNGTKRVGNKKYNRLEIIYY